MDGSAGLVPPLLPGLAGLLARPTPGLETLPAQLRALIEDEANLHTAAVGQFDSLGMRKGGESGLASCSCLNLRDSSIETETRITGM